jgi:hypothetical protein
MAQAAGIEDKSYLEVYAYSHDVLKNTHMIWSRITTTTGDGRNARWLDQVLPAIREGWLPTYTQRPASTLIGVTRPGAPRGLSVQ